MDQMMVDISAVPEAAIEDSVTLVGRDGEAFISVEEIADMAYSFNYELVCGIARRVPRVYFRGGKPCRTVSYVEDHMGKTAVRLSFHMEKSFWDGAALS